MITSKLDLTDNDDKEDDKEFHYELSQSEHVDDIRLQAIECMDLFFVDKKYWAGGKIAKSKLFTEENIVTVMGTTILDAIDVAYLCLAEQQPQSYKTKERRMVQTDDGLEEKEVEIKGWMIQLCYDILKACPRRMVPKCHAGGILLVYLSLCQGINYLEKLKEVNATLKGKYNSTI